MASYEGLDRRVRELIEARYKEFEQDVQHRQGLAERHSKLQNERVKRRHDFMAAIGTDMKKLDAAVENENRTLEAELAAFLKEFRPQAVDRAPLTAATAKDAAIRMAVLAEAGHPILPVFASSIYTADKSIFAHVAGIKEWNDSIGTGWVLPDNPARILVWMIGHNPGAVCGLWDYHWVPSPFGVTFAFVPPVTATYEMTAVIAFHGFYILKSDDGLFTCRDASVKLTAQMNAHQYADTAWTDFTLLDIEKENADEITNYDRTHFLDVRADLRKGDPVVVTVKGAVDARAHGGGAYAELNFHDGTANYIEPLFLSVQQV